MLSLEFFPPKDPSGLASTLSLIEELSALNPTFMTVTYGAGGAQTGPAEELVRFINEKLKLIAVQHLTCSRHSVAEIDLIVSDLLKRGIRHILALRGDPAQGETEFRPHPAGFSCARDLTRHLAGRSEFSLAVAGYPEVHREAHSPESDLAYLKEKVDAGGEIIITQLFFDNSHYFRFVDAARKIGITAPIVPGIMPIGNIKQLKRFTSLCGAIIPAEVEARLAKLENDPEGVVRYGTEYAISQGEALLAAGVPGLHLYTLNKSAQVRPIIEQLGLSGPGKF